MPTNTASSITFPPSPDAILTAAQVAQWLQVKPRQVIRLRIPCADLGRKTKRYRGRDVLSWLDKQCLASAA